MRQGTARVGNEEEDGAIGEIDTIIRYRYEVKKLTSSSLAASRLRGGTANQGSRGRLEPERKPTSHLNSMVALLADALEEAMLVLNCADIDIFKGEHLPVDGVVELLRSVLTKCSACRFGNGHAERAAGAVGQGSGGGDGGDRVRPKITTTGSVALHAAAERTPPTAPPTPPPLTQPAAVLPCALSAQ